MGLRRDCKVWLRRVGGFFWLILQITDKDNHKFPYTPPHHDALPENATPGDGSIRVLAVVGQPKPISLTLQVGNLSHDDAHFFWVVVVSVEEKLVSL